MKTSLRTLLIAGGFVAVAAAPAYAACYDVYGCTNRNVFNVPTLLSPGPNCEFLYEMRNGIYAEHRYCFQTARAQAIFSNANCVSSNANAIGLSRIEQANAATILKAENSMGCPE